MEAAKPLVSIVIPVYNVEKYLPVCLDSLLAQTLQQIEIICVNDHSPDNSIHILRGYAQKDARIKVIDLPENRRQGGARNAGIRAASADWIGFVDSDDWVAPGIYKSLYHAAIKSKADVATCNHFCYYGEGDIRETAYNRLPSQSRSRERDCRIINHGLRLWASIFKKTSFFENRLFFPEKMTYEDNAIGIPLFLCAEKIIQVPEALYYYRCNNFSTTRSVDNYAFFDRLETSKIFLENMKRLGFYHRFKDETDRNFIIMFFKESLIGCFVRFSKPERTYMKKILTEMDEIMPGYRKYPAYRQIALKYRVLFGLCRLNIPLAIAAYRMVRFLKLSPAA